MAEGHRSQGREEMSAAAPRGSSEETEGGRLGDALEMYVVSGFA